MKNKDGFRVGDRVGLLHEKGEGIVVGVRGTTIRIELDDFPNPCDYPAAHLYLLRKSDPHPAQSADFPTEINLPAGTKHPNSIALLRFSGSVQTALYVFNQTEQILSAQWFQKNQKQQPWIWQSEFKVQPGKGLFLMTIPHSVVHLNIRLQGFYCGNSIAPKSTVDEVWTPPADRWVESCSRLVQGLELVRHDIPKPTHGGLPVYESGKKNKSDVSTQLPYILDIEFDLHAEVCIPGFRAMTAPEILERQKEIAMQTLLRGRMEQWNSLTLIHGIGKGVLKSEVVSLIRKQGLSYEELPHGGAIRISFRGFL